MRQPKNARAVVMQGHDHRGHGHPNGVSAAPGQGAGHVLCRVCQVLIGLSFAGWLGGHIYSFLGTWSRYQLQYDRKYMPYINSNCGDSKFHHVTLGLNHCDAFLEAISIPAWERALFEEIQKLPVCSDGKCDSVVSGVTNNKTWLCFCFIVFIVSIMFVLRIKWYMERQIRNNLPLDHPAAYIEAMNAPAYVDRDGRSWAYQVGLRRRINTSSPSSNGEAAVITPCDRYGDVTL